ncbi:MAG: two-component system sensor histidine kinase NtrB [Gemmatimonadaceae bacterium]
MEIHSALALITKMAAALAQRPELSEAMPGVLAELTAALGAQGCALIGLSGGDGTLIGAAGPRPPAVSEVEGAAGTGEPAANEIVVAPVRSANRTIGLLGARAVTRADSSDLLALAADVLAPHITAAALRRQLESAVHERAHEIDAQRRFIQRIIDSLPVGLHVIDREYRVQAWNHKRETGMLGVLREEAIGRTIFELLHRQPVEMLRAEFDEVFESGDVRQYYMDSAATGEERSYRVTKVPMRVDDDAVTHVITIGEDVTEARRSRERVVQAEKLAAIGQLAAGVMHEINNPMATIAACSESIALRLTEPDAPDQLRAAVGEYLGIVDQEIRRCARIVNGLLDFSRPSARARADVSVNDVVSETLFLLKHHPGFRSMVVERDFDATLAPIPGNPDALIQVIMALLLNAMDAMNAGSDCVIRVMTGRHPTQSDEVIVEVRDSGKGIPRSELPKVFEPFYTTKGPGRGTGLGLAICYGIIQEHGGRIEVESAVGVGSTFRVVLPSGEEPRPGAP